MNYKEELEKLIDLWKTDGNYLESDFFTALRTLINSIDQPATLEVKDNLRIEIATKIFCEMVRFKPDNVLDYKNIINNVFEIADAIIERGKK